MVLWGTYFINDRLFKVYVFHPVNLDYNGTVKYINTCYNQSGGCRNLYVQYVHHLKLKHVFPLLINYKKL